jgi:hypothetical protein
MRKIINSHKDAAATVPATTPANTTPPRYIGEEEHAELLLRDATLHWLRDNGLVRFEVTPDGEIAHVPEAGREFLQADERVYSLAKQLRAALPAYVANKTAGA